MKKTTKFTTQDGRTIETVACRNYPNRKTASGGTGVCISAVASYFDVTPDMYRYAFSYKTGCAPMFTQIRRQGYTVKKLRNVGGRYTKHALTVNNLKKSLALWEQYGADDKFIVEIRNHIFVLDGNGDVVCDTCPTERARVWAVYHVTKK